MKIKNFKRYQGGWEWEVEEDGETTHYHTNQVGNGLFQAGPGPEMFKYQTLGTSQFSLPDDPAKAKRKTRYHFTKR